MLLYCSFPDTVVVTLSLLPQPAHAAQSGRCHCHQRTPSLGGDRRTHHDKATQTSWRGQGHSQAVSTPTVYIPGERRPKSSLSPICPLLRAIVSHQASPSPIVPNPHTILPFNFLSHLSLVLHCPIPPSYSHHHCPIWWNHLMDGKTDCVLETSRQPCTGVVTSFFFYPLSVSISLSLSPFNYSISPSDIPSLFLLLSFHPLLHSVV